MLLRLLSTCCWAIAFAAESAPNMLTIMPDLSSGFVRNYNPFRADALATTKDFVFEYLYIYEENEVHYRLAEKFQLDKDLKGITITLRKGIKWSDGMPFTADDVAYSLQLLKQEPKLDYDSLGGWLSHIEVYNENEVYISLVRPNAQIAQKIASAVIVPRHQWENVDNKLDYTNPTPVGSGPFTTIKAFSSNNIVQCRNELYWQKDELKVDCIRYPMVRTNDELISRLSSGEFDWASAFIPDIDRNYASYSPNYHYFHRPSTVVSLMLNFKHPDEEVRNTINDIRFRRAISMGLERDTLINVALFGQGQKATFASGLESKFDEWVSDTSAEQHLYYIRYHPDAAQRLLDEAGIVDRDGDGFRDLPSGKPFFLSIVAPIEWTDFTSAANVASDMLRQIGLDVRAIALPLPVYIDRLCKGKFDIGITNYFSGLTPYRYLDSAFNSAYQTATYPRFAQHKYVNKDVDTLLDAFLLTTNKQEQVAIINDLHLIIAEQQVTVPLYYKLNTVEFTTSRFAGWRVKPNGKPNVPPIWYTERARLIQILDLKPIDPIIFRNQDKKWLN
ncbi:ABC transporter substrate-binding protein [Enterovibrio nigricans]|uniref:Peptide/nickel transport system substrate-binding protein n=1 Tax=Enterovibrio nigricans DSM 22720 TaxID=1121868 RepID=A0A1T4UMN7_9GAMM|nr:ABC transporter substrate-binding protein [Enterovibrio nigricans]SKA53860.1 peptide/nickel transport system substrate-binding protein [Enterovibrio nigricans DSM 22720]